MELLHSKAGNKKGKRGNEHKASKLGCYLINKYSPKAWQHIQHIARDYSPSYTCEYVSWKRYLLHKCVPLKPFPLFLLFQFFDKHGSSSHPLKNTCQRDQHICMGGGGGDLDHNQGFIIYLFKLFMYFWKDNTGM